MLCGSTADRAGIVPKAGVFMQKHDETQQAAELRRAFLRHLPKRLETLRKRGYRLCTQGWDINALTLLFREIQTLAGTCGRYGLLDLGEHLFALESSLTPFIEDVSIPNNMQMEAFAAQLRGLEPLIVRHEQQYGEATSTQAAAALTAAPVTSGTFALQVVPPPEYWKRFAPIAPLGDASQRRPAPVPEPPIAPTPAVPAPLITPIAAPAAAAPVQGETPLAHTETGERRKVFHLSDGNPLACEVDQKIEAAGYELTLVDSVAELKEVLGALAPHLAIVDAPFQDSLETIGDMIKVARTRLGRRLNLLTFSHSAELPIRLRAMRAGADSFIPLPAQSGDVMARISELLDVESSDPYRVLIVEDDRSQAIFAESILRKAGMSTNAVTDPLAALDQLESFRPELILMDLYMPNCSGMELTSIIREREAFINTPIVFLSGEQNQEMHFEALNAGGDDFLSKPIRPKHLISAVTNRVRRARSQGRRAMTQNPRDPVTGLYDRAFVLDRLNAKLAAEDPASHGGGLLYVVIDGAGQIRERVGLTIFEALLNQVGAFVTAHIDDKDLVARYGDTSFALLAGGGDEDALIGIASTLRDRIAREVFEHEGKTLTVSLAIGICPFSAGLGDAGAMLNAAERAMTDSRSPASTQTRIGVFHPTRPKSSTDAQQTLTQLIRDALKGEDFQLLFQPIVALQSDSDEAFQALLRLRASDGKLYTAAEILPLAEREGLSADVDRWVVSRCLLVMAERQRQMRPVRLFVSQSMEAALDSSRTGWLRQLLETRRLSGEMLVLEFKLQEVLGHLNDFVAFANAIADLGVSISISTFDVKENSLQLLERLPIAYIKLATRYGGANLRDNAVRDELRTIVTVAHHNGAKVIASRIEDAQTASQLWNVGIDYLQGDFVQQAGQDLVFDFNATTA